MTDFYNGLCAGVLAGGGMGCLAGWTVAALCAASIRSEEKAKIDAAQFTDPETGKYGPVDGLLRPGDEWRADNDRKWQTIVSGGYYPSNVLEYRRPIQPQ